MQQKMNQADLMFRKFQVWKFRRRNAVPAVFMAIQVNAEELVRRKNEINLPGKAAAHVTVTHMVIKAVADVLVRYPLLYSFYSGKKAIENPELVVNVPVDVGNHVEYIVIHSPETKTLPDIAMECKNEIENIRKGDGQFIHFLEQLNKTPLHLFFENGRDILGITRKYYGNFPISNFGSFGVSHGFLALSQPIVAGLCIGTLDQGNLPITISFDHRVVDGAYVGRFLNEVKRALESFSTKGESL